MARYRITTLTPIHISSGKDYEINFNMLYSKGFIYIYDEFEIAQYFIDNNIQIPSDLDSLKRKISKYRDKIISSNIHIRKIETKFSQIDKILLENVSTANNPIIPGSSIKGSFRTAILDCLYERANNNIKESKCESIFLELKNKNIDKNRFIDEKGKNKEPFDEDFRNLFTHLKVSDSLSKLETKIYKTINIKKDKTYQENRSWKVKSIINLVEAIKPNQIFEIEIRDDSREFFKNELFTNLGTICNGYYIHWYKDELSNYFKAPTKATKNTFNKLRNLNNNCFIINLGRFTGAERKSINHLRYIKNSKDEDKSTTTTRTYALEEPANDEIYYEKELIPFGYLLFEKI